MDGEKAGRQVNFVTVTGTTLPKARAKTPLDFHSPLRMANHRMTARYHDTPRQPEVDCVTLQLEPNIALGHGSVVLKNVRDNNQFLFLTRQVYPEDNNSLYSAYLDATEKAHGYLMLELSQDMTNLGFEPAYSRQNIPLHFTHI